MVTVIGLRYFEIYNTRVRTYQLFHFNFTILR